MAKHWQPKDTRDELAQEITEWVQRVSNEPHAALPSLMKMTLRDLQWLVMAMHDSDRRAK